MPPEFQQSVIGWDAQRHEAVQGRDHRPLSREALFDLLGRRDLLQQSESLMRRRVLLAAAAVVVLAAGVVGGVWFFAQQPNLNGSPCVDRVDLYNQCVSDHRLDLDAGIASLAIGAVAASLLATFAYWADPRVLDDDEAQRLIARHNAELLKRLRPQAWLLPGGAALGLSTSF